MLRITCLLMLIISSFSLAAQDKDEGSRRELAKLQGDWKLIAGQSAGQIMPPAVITNFSMSVKDSMYEFRNSEETERGTMTLDPGKKPTQVDILISDGSFKGQKQLGIYELNGNKIKFCLSMPDDPKRPEKFESTEGNKCIIFEFLQVKK